VAYELASAYSVRAIRVSQYARYIFLFVDQSSSRRLEKIGEGEDISTSSEVIEAHMLNFMPKFEFLQLFFFWGGGVPVGVCANKLWSISNACKKIEAAVPLRAEM